MTRPTPARALVPALMAAALAGCTTAVAGTAAPDLGTAFTERVDGVSLTDVIDDPQHYLADLAAAPDGTVVALMAGTSEEDAVVVRLAPGEDGLAVLGTVPVPPIEDDPGLHVAADGTVVVVGTADAEDTGEQVVLATVAPGADSAGTVDLEHAYGDFLPQVGGTALSPDGRVLYVSFGYHDDVPGRVVAFDAATGEVLDEVDVDPGSGPGGHYGRHLAVRPAGGVAVLVSAYDDGAGDDTPRAVLVEYDAGLEPVGEPVTLLPDAVESISRELFALPGGGWLAVAVDGTYQSSRVRLVVVRDGAVDRVHALDEVVDLEAVPDDVDLGPGGHYLYVPWTGGDGDTHGVTTVDLATGEAVAQVPLCDGPGFAATVAVGSDGTELVAGGGCGEGDREDVAVLLR
ncbi:hypothetical protein [Trujillonella humicola]|uniref:hypothetical protein n=1 Tax=Trujillonella humicola TaxID=3383699 RepID=UPI003905DCFC